MRPNEEIESRRVLVSLKTLSEMIDTSRGSVRRWLKEAGIRPAAIGRGRAGAIRYRWDEVEAWLDDLPKCD